MKIQPPGSETDFKKHILKQRAEKLSKSKKKMDSQADLMQIIPFKLENEQFALETKYVKEIYPLKDYTFLPCAPPFVYGLCNIRRKILPIMDLKVFFSLPNNENTEKKLLIMENEEVEFAILIEDFSEIKNLSREEMQISLPTLTGIRADFLKGLTLDGTVILDGQKLLTSKYLLIDINNETL